MSLRKLVLGGGLGLGGAGLLAYQLRKDKADKASEGGAGGQRAFKVGPLKAWQHDWDGAQGSPTTAVRRLVFVRHGEYETWGETDAEQRLTERGRAQASATGRRLRQLAQPFHLLRSDMTRARETFDLISQELAPEQMLSSAEDNMLAEGYPFPTEPPTAANRLPYRLLRSGSRLEAAFRRHVHRAAVWEEDSKTLVVCHANVIRFFVCRALQLPPEAWLRISLPHGSLTTLAVFPDGKVDVESIGDSGHFPKHLITSSNLSGPPKTTAPSPA